MQRNPEARKVLSMFLEAGILEPPPKVLAAATHFFLRRWVGDMAHQLNTVRNSYENERQMAKAVLRMQKASIAEAKKSIDRGESFSVTVYHERSSPAKNGLPWSKKEILYDLDPKTERNRWKVKKRAAVPDLSFIGGDADDVLHQVSALEGWTSVAGVPYLQDVIDTNTSKAAGLQGAINQLLSYIPSEGAALISGGGDQVVCAQDFSGWTLWERRMPDPKVRREVEGQMPPLTLDYSSERNDSALATWDSSRWTVTVYGRSKSFGLETFFSNDYLDQRKMAQTATQVRMAVYHELRHYAQSSLQKLLNLSYAAGTPRLTDPSEANIHGLKPGMRGTDWDPEKRMWVDNRIPHQVRDIEFETRLGDALQDFRDLANEVTDAVEKFAPLYRGGPVPDLAETLNTALDVFIGRKKDAPPKGIRSPLWHQQSWLYYLQRNDKARYKLAVSKLVGEVSRLRIIPKAVSRARIPEVAPDHPAWGKAVTEYLRSQGSLGVKGREEDDLRDYGNFVDSLPAPLLRRHRSLVRDSGNKEYWLTPRWQDYLIRDVDNEELERRRTEAGEHPRL